LAANKYQTTSDAGMAIAPSWRSHVARIDLLHLLKNLTGQLSLHCLSLPAIEALPSGSYFWHATVSYDNGVVLRKLCASCTSVVRQYSQLGSNRESGANVLFRLKVGSADNPMLLVCATELAII